MSDKYKLIKEVFGLNVIPTFPYGGGEPSGSVNADALEKILEQATRVYGQPNSLLSSQDFHLYQWPHDTHTAILLGIKEIEKKKCEHLNKKPKHKFIADLNQVHIDLSDIECQDCGAKLKAEWREL